MIAPYLKRLALLLALLAYLPSLSIAQTYPSIPSNTVIGRTAVGTGPAQAIPFSTLIAVMLQSSLTIPTLNTNTVVYRGSTSGQATVSAQAVAGTPSIKWPTTSGTVPSTATSPILLDAVTGSISCPTCATSTSVASPIVSTRAAAQTLNLSSYSGIRTLGFSAVGDGGGALFTQVASQPFCGPFSDTASFQDAVGTWFKISEPLEYNFKQFGAKFDALGGAGTNDSAAVQSAINCMAQQVGDGVDIGGGAGGIIRAPAGEAIISSTITVRNYVTIVGAGVYSSIFYMPGSFAAAAHFFILGDQYTRTDIAALQSRGSAGNLTINTSSQWHRSGTIYQLNPAVPAIYSTTNNSGVNFTVTGTDRYGAAQSDTFAGPTAGGVANSSKFFKTITQVATSAATVGSVSVGFPQIATFGSRLQNLQLFTGNLNATQFTTNINNSSGLITGHSGNAMLYTNSAQHTAALYQVKIFAGNRSGTLFEVGVGGASYFTFSDVETFNSGNCGGCVSNNPGMYFNYAGLLGRAENLVVQGPGAAGGSSIGLQIEGGFMDIRGYHTEGIAIAIDMNITSVNNGSLTLMNINGSASVTDLVRIEGGAASNITYIQGVYPNGSTHTVNNKGVNTTGNVFAWTQY